MGHLVVPMMRMLAAWLALLLLQAHGQVTPVGSSNKDRYVHVSYRFQQHLPGFDPVRDIQHGSASSLARDGTGDFWLNWQTASHVRLRLQGVSDSPGLGRIQETIYLDSEHKMMYARVEIPNHRLNQCTKYQFPDISMPDNQQRIAVLIDRKSKVSTWDERRKHRQHEQWDMKLRVSRIQWSPKRELGFVMSNQKDDELLGIELEEGDDMIKKIEFRGPPDTSAQVPQAQKKLFEPPDDCFWPDEAGTPAEAPVVDLRPPHERSSTLFDLMLMLSSEKPVEEWSEQYLLLTTMLLPADISVGVEEQNSPPETLPQMSQEVYTHAGYNFELHRMSAKRSGQGDLWMSWGQEPVIRLRGVAQSLKFGEGVITILLDSRTRIMYANVELKSLRKGQCIKYPFPDITTQQNQLRLLTLKGRKAKFSKWELADQSGSKEKVTSIAWTKRYRLAFLQAEDNSNQITGIQLMEGNRLVKKVDFKVPLDHSDTVPEAAQTLFQPPADCKSPDELSHELASVDLRGPHQRSSVLNDLMLLLASENPKADWSEEFLLMSALLLPGDISVMLEDPQPPNIEQLHHVAFDYSAITASHGGQVSRSQGSMWINMEKRAFRLRGNAKNTKVGDLSIDLLVHAGLDEPKIFANVQLEDEDERQCVIYDYPTLTDHPRQALEEAAGHELRFYSISEIDGEDCAIFIGSLPRGRSIHIWVDMESENPNAFLRSEIHKGDKVLRSTNVDRWRTGEDVLVQVEPRREWNCQERELGGRLANLDIRSMHKKSIQLEDALFALHELGQDFAVREILGLTGDVAIIVKVPQPPDLSVLQQATFNFHVMPDSSDDLDGKINGNAAVDKRSGRVRMEASTRGTAGRRVTIALDDGKVLAVRFDRENSPRSEGQCLKIDLKGKSMVLSDGPRIGTGLFEGVESLKADTEECNHFSFNAGGADSRSLDLWYSEETDEICQVDLLTAGGRVGASKLVRIEVSIFLEDFLPQVENFAGFAGNEEDWENCIPLSAEQSPWLGLHANSAEKLIRSAVPEASTLGRVSEVLGMLGILPTQATAVLLSTEVAGLPAGFAVAEVKALEKDVQMKTAGELTLVPKPPGPDCCATDGLHAHPIDKAWPIVERHDDVYSCVGGDTLTEEEWIGQLTDRLNTPGNHAVGVCLVEGYFEREVAPGATVHPQWVNDEVMSPLLKHFSFAFTSTFPLKGYPEGKIGTGQKFTGETWRKRHRGEGELRVDLERRRLYLMSKTQDFSAGIPEVKSEIIYRGDLNQLWARTRFSGRLEYVQCWQIDTAKALPPLPPEAPRNPFQRAQLHGAGSPVPGSEHGDLAQRYSFFPSTEKRVDVYVKDQRELAYLQVHDVARDAAVGVQVQGWLTAPVEDKWFEVGEDWECNPELADQYLEQLASWDLLQIFMPAGQPK